MMPPPLLFLPLLLTVTAVTAAVPAPHPAVVSRIAFGSCANQSSPQPIWDAIVDFDPQLFIWMGDNVYGDNRRPWRVFGRERTIGPWKNVERFFPSTEDELRRRYEIAKSNPGYSRLRQTARVIGTWDDHDYGLNDAGKEFSGKNTSQRLLLDFLDEAEDSHRRKQAGVYVSYLFGPEGKQVKVILLDTRYHRDPLSSDGSILGESQWAWLEGELNGPKSQITIIVSSVQRSGVFFISGDVHFGEITRNDCGCEYSLYDITSSGLTQAVEKAVPPPLALLVRFFAVLTPNTMRVYSTKCRRRSCTYGQPNFGAIQIAWDAVPQTVNFEVRDINGDSVSGVDILLSELQPRSMNRNNDKRVKFQHHCSLEIDLPWIVRHRLAFLVSIAVSVLMFMLVLIANIIIVAGKKSLQKFKTD